MMMMVMMGLVFLNKLNFLSVIAVSRVNWLGVFFGCRLVSAPHTLSAVNWPVLDSFKIR